MSNKIVKTVSADGVARYAETERTFVDNIVGAVTSPMDAFSESNEYINKQDAAQQTLAAGVAGFVAGDMFGHKVPVLGGRR